MKSYAQYREAEAARHARESRHRDPEDHERLFLIAQRLAEAKCHFAGTMNYIPHSYKLRKTWTSDVEFVDTIKMIDEYHYEERFRIGTAEYLHDDEKIIGSELSVVHAGNVSTYEIDIGGPRTT
ncbi:MAG: hypothetical protein F4121_05915 [Acidimicrobiia bacterium]|nr:hypothetical protein [Acidimicrobiia bacterium]MYC46465.1 hypothetical protein [Acidimicrobiia bacterium]MYI19622.1 hypothetical protein [Acidimicrobiia bacterium]